MRGRSRRLWRENSNLPSCFKGCEGLWNRGAENFPPGWFLPDQRFRPFLPEQISRIRYIFLFPAAPTSAEAWIRPTSPDVVAHFTYV